jgi:hypothetical protein
MNRSAIAVNSAKILLAAAGEILEADEIDAVVLSSQK